MASSCTRRALGWKLRDTSCQKEQSGIGKGGGVTVAGGVQGKVGCGAQGHGLVGDISGRGMVGPGDLGGPFQPERFYQL